MHLRFKVNFEVVTIATTCLTQFWRCDFITWQEFTLKVGCSCVAISTQWGQIDGQCQSLHKLQQNFVSNCSFCLKCPETQCWVNKLNSVKIWTLSKPSTLALTSSHTKGKRLCMDLSWHKHRGSVRKFSYLFRRKHFSSSLKPSCWFLRIGPQTHRFV